jgi:hypothetical protein
VFDATQFPLPRRLAWIEAEVRRLQRVLVVVAVTDPLDRTETPGPMCAIGS